MRDDENIVLAARSLYLVIFVFINEFFYEFYFKVVHL